LKFGVKKLNTFALVYRRCETYFDNSRAVCVTDGQVNRRTDGITFSKSAFNVKKVVEHICVDIYHNISMLI